MIAFIKSLFVKDLDAILAFITDAIAKLEAHAEAKADETLQHVEDAAASTALAQAAAASQAKAQTVAAKLKALL